MPSSVSWFCFALIAFTFGQATQGSEKVALEGGLSFTRFSVLDGLPHDSVYGILQDQRGFMWIATEGGLCRFDGYKFQVFQHDPNAPDSLSESGMGRLIEDRQGLLWIGTWGGGVNRFDPRTGATAHLLNNSGEGQTKGSDRILDLLLVDDGAVWIGTYQGGVYRYLPQKSQTQVPATDPQPQLPHERVWSLAQARDGKIWVGTGAGLKLLDPATGSLVTYGLEGGPVNRLSHPIAKAVLVSKASRVWVGTAAGLNLFNPETGSFRHYLTGEEDRPAADIRVLYEDSIGHLWIGTLNQGLIRLNLETGEMVWMNHSAHDLTSLSQNSVEAIYEDRSGNLWVGTLRGLNKASLSPPKFRTYTHELGGDSPQGIGAICRDRRGTLWLGSFGGGLKRFDRESGRVKVYSQENGSGLGNNTVRAIVEDSREFLWVGTFYEGLYRLDPHSETFAAFRHDPQRPECLSNNQVRCLFIDDRERLWVGTNQGLNLWDGEGPGFFNFFNDPLFRDGVGNGLVYTITAGEHDEMLIGTHEGLFVMKPDTGFWKVFRRESGNPTSLSHSRVYSVCRDSQSRIWVGTQMGLNRMLPGGAGFERIANPGAHGRNVIRAIIEDDEGHLWLSSEYGLARFLPSENRFRNYDLYDGLADNDFNLGAALKTAEGELFFGGTSGMTSFFPVSVTENPFVPPVVLTGLKKLNKPVSLAQLDAAGKGIRLEPGENVISIEFAALDFSPPAKNNYRYRLIGFHTAWVDSGSERQVTYTNLNPGKYTFQAMASKDDQVWSATPLSIPITVIPPMWRTWWAIALYLALAILVLMTIPFLRIRQLNSRRRELGRMVAESTVELETKNRRLLDINAELLALDEMVHAINSEVDLEKLFVTLLEQGIQLFPNAETGGFLRYDNQDARFRFSALVGYQMSEVEHIELSMDQARERYINGKDQIMPGIYLVNSRKSLPLSITFERISKPKCMLAMTLAPENRIDGLLIFENFVDEQAFNDSDTEKLRRFRDHAVTAVAKARLLKELTDTARHLKDTRKRFMDAAHQAGMAEIATYVLHNVGNSLNSINTSTEQLLNLAKAPAVALFGKILKLIDLHKADLNTFLTEDEQGRQLPAALIEVSQTMGMLYGEYLREVKELKSHVLALKNITRTQNEYARVDGLAVEVDLNEVVEEVLRIEENALTMLDVQIVLNLNQLPPVRLHKPKLIRVLVNLVNHALETMSGNIKRELEIQSFKKEDHVLFVLRDNGRGVAREKLNEIFRQDLLSTEGGGGFALHYCANALQEMGGTIEAQSEGIGCGTTMMVQIPILLKQSNSLRS